MDKILQAKHHRYAIYSSPMDSSGITDRNITIYWSTECSDTKESCPSIIATGNDSIQWQPLPQVDTYLMYEISYNYTCLL